MNAAEYLAHLDEHSPALSLLGANRVDFAQIVKRVRSEIAGAVKHGALPEGFKALIRSERYGSLHISIVAWSGAVFSPEYIEHLMDGSIPWHSPSRWSEVRHQPESCDLSEELHAARWLIERITDRHNYNRSQIEYDIHNVGFYVHLTTRTIEAIAAQGIRFERDPAAAEAFAKLHAEAAQAARVVGAAYVRAKFPRGIAHASEESLSRLIKLAAQGTELVFAKREGRWIPMK